MHQRRAPGERGRERGKVGLRVRGRDAAGRDSLREQDRGGNVRHTPADVVVRLRGVVARELERASHRQRVQVGPRLHERGSRTRNERRGETRSRERRRDGGEVLTRCGRQPHAACDHLRFGAPIEAGTARARTKAEARRLTRRVHGAHRDHAVRIRGRLECSRGGSVVADRVDDQQSPARRLIRRARGRRLVAIHGGVRIVRAVREREAVHERRVHYACAGRIRPLERRDPPVLIRTRVARLGIHLGEQEARAVRGTDDDTRRIAAEDREHAGAVTVLVGTALLARLVEHLDVAVDEVARRDDLPCREIRVPRLEAGVEQRDRHVRAVEPEHVDRHHVQLADRVPVGAVEQTVEALGRGS